MLRKVLRSKIHMARITQCDLHYVGSITIDADLLAAVDIRPNEAVWIYDITNGNRFETYVIHGEPGSGVIGVNGAAARLVDIGHELIIANYAYLTGGSEELDNHVAKVIVCDENNCITDTLHYDSLIHPSESNIST
ncbi:aspartate 1-decarboxylase [Poriferisphaera sp. WC338]|uniref:aspartate 1-decarboxylase n=1 Tax=Poriferisphaera sp. WC338 TaxID=3425129 RepID=UPI003D81B0DE